MNNRLGLLLLLTVTTAAVLGGLWGNQVSAGSSGGETEQLLRTFVEALTVIQTHHVKEVSARDLVENAIRGMLWTLDPHSSFFSNTDYARLQEEQQGKYFGLGITIRPEAPGSGRVVVVDPPAPGTPAYKAGLLAGDIIYKIRGEPIEDWDINTEVIPNLKGPKGTTVEITVERPGEAVSLDFTIERDAIPLYTIKFVLELQPGTGYIRIDRFSENTGGELDQALRELNEPELSGLILDLRGNPGGALAAAIEVADRFLERGELIVSTRSRRGASESYRAPRGKRYSYPMVVLLNQYSASASEIVAGALQDHDRALIVGKTSFGKALVQTIYPLDGNRGLALTTGKYYTPSDRLIQRDYSRGFYDYFNSPRPRAREFTKHATDGGRPVYSGGGIMPDEEIEQRAFPRLARELTQRNLFYQFAAKLGTGEIQTDAVFEHDPKRLRELDQDAKKEIMSRLSVSDVTLDRFRGFLGDLETPVQGLDEEFVENAELIRNQIKRELFLLRFGEEAGYEVGLELDRQVQRALAVLPEAAKLIAEKSATG